MLRQHSAFGLVPNTTITRKSLQSDSHTVMSYCLINLSEITFSKKSRQIVYVVCISLTKELTHSPHTVMINETILLQSIKKKKTRMSRLKNMNKITNTAFWCLYTQVMRLITF